MYCVTQTKMFYLFQDLIILHLKFRVVRKNVNYRAEIHIWGIVWQYLFSSVSVF